MIHRDCNSTGGLGNQVIKILEESVSYKARDGRTGSSWYELTHDRMIKVY